MEYSRIKKTVFNQCIKAAWELSELELGINNSKILYYEAAFQLMEKYKLKTKKELKFNKKYNLIMTEVKNIMSSRKWAKYITVFEEIEVIFIKSTECYYITDSGKKIKKDKIKYIIEEG